jgi:hypothetical protein
VGVAVGLPQAVGGAEELDEGRVRRDRVRRRVLPRELGDGGAERGLEAVRVRDAEAREEGGEEGVGLDEGEAEVDGGDLRVALREGEVLGLRRRGRGRLGREGTVRRWWSVAGGRTARMPFSSVSGPGPDHCTP